MARRASSRSSGSSAKAWSRALRQSSTLAEETSFSKSSAPATRASLHESISRAESVSARPSAAAPTHPISRFAQVLETRFDDRLIAGLAAAEKQIQQNFRPVIAVHKWFARRPGSLFRGLLLSEFDDRPLGQSYFEGHDLEGVVLDPFMGGGTTLFEAN